MKGGSCYEQVVKNEKSREVWKSKAVARGGENCRLRAEVNRLKKDRDKYKGEAREAKKENVALKASAGAPALKSKPALVHVCFLLFCVAGLGFRAVSRVLGVLGCFIGLKKAPCPQTVINWIANLSIARIQSAGRFCNAPDSSGFIWKIDASVGHGAGKILAVLALRADHHLINSGAPTLQDVHCVSVAVAATWTGESIAELLMKAINAIGAPLAIVKDGGTDLAKAVRILVERGIGLPAVDDISHFFANLLKREYGTHPTLAGFLSACGAASKKFKQSILACLAPPRISIKARFMNLKRLVDWADKILKHSPKGRAARGSMLEKLRKCLDTLPECRPFIKRFLRDASALDNVQKILKNRGLSRETAEESKAVLEEALPADSAVKIGALNWIDKHLAIAEELGLADAGIPTTSDSIESLFGVAKVRGTGPVKDANRIAARLPAFCGPVPTMEDAEAALKITVKERERVLESGQSLIKQRREVLPNPGTLESLVPGCPMVGLTLIPGAKNRQKNGKNTIVSDCCQEWSNPKEKRDKEAVFPASGLLSGGPALR
ncbi:hypothetical protein QUF70_19555 [Desulfobacterales bacterium HSG17]|nr:hypothetical protein [Desulfobacterales bacterium HSG17]